MIQGMKDILSLKGKNALITGGNRGIGKGIATAMAQTGANISILCRDQDTARATVEELSQYGGKYRHYYVDVRDKEVCKKAVEDTIRDFGRIDILVNNSGIGGFMGILDMDESLDHWYNVIDTNLNGPLVMSYLAGKHMRDMGGGIIVNISSNAAFIVNKPQLMAPYNTAKAGLDRLTKCLAYEWAPHKIRVNAIAPGYTDTDLGVLPPEIAHYKDHWMAQTPVGRFGTVMEVGALAVYLASEAAEQITGSTFTIDGGYSLAM